MSLSDLGNWRLSPGPHTVNTPLGPSSGCTHSTEQSTHRSRGHATWNPCPLPDHTLGTGNPEAPYSSGPKGHSQSWHCSFCHPFTQIRVDSYTVLSVHTKCRRAGASRWKEKTVGCRLRDLYLDPCLGLQMLGAGLSKSTCYQYKR